MSAARAKKKPQEEFNLFDALKMLEKEKGIPVDYMIEKIQTAIGQAIKKDPFNSENSVVEIDPETGRFYVALRKDVVEEVEEKPQPTGNPELDKMISDGELAIREMKRLNDSIKDETISRQIDRLEEVSGKIFDCVKADPEKLPQIRKFMNYYLPTTLKLLNAYDRMSSQGVEGQNISGTMERVESMMSNIVTAFERQLDSLFGDQALDISTDITVLENMMAREGLSDDPIHQTREEPPAAEEKESGEDGDGIRLEL